MQWYASVNWLVSIWNFEWYVFRHHSKIFQVPKIKLKLIQSKDILFWLLYGLFWYEQMKEWITVKITFHTFLLGQVVAVQVLFSGKGITSPMAPKAAIETIKNIIISCTFKKKSQDNHSLLDAYKMVDKYQTEKKSAVCCDTSRWTQFQVQLQGPALV